MKNFRVFQKLKRLHKQSLYVVSALVLAGASLIGSVPSTNIAHAAIGSVTEYTVPNPYSDKRPGYLTIGPDNNIWYTNDLYYSRIDKLTTSGSFTQYSPTLSSGKYMAGVTKGSDGNIWYAEQYTVGSVNYGRIVSITTSGTLVGTYNIPSGNVAQALTLGPDGNVWFTESSNKVGKITTAGTITEYSAGAAADITTGPDGNLWFTPGVSGLIGKITTSGTVTYYTISAIADGITAGSDGNLWFTETGNNKVGKITTSGTSTEYSIPTTSSQPKGITAGSDGALWFTEAGGGKIGRITTSGTITEYSVSGVSYGSLDHIVTGPDGAVWFSDKYAGKIGRMATQLTDQTISFTSTAPSSAVIDGPTYTPTATATSGLSVAITVDSSSSSVCSIVSGVVSFQGAGTCILNANQGGNADYNPAPQVQQSFTVAPVDADSSVGLSCPATAHIGDTVTCTITIDNAGPAAASNASLSALFSNSFSGAALSGGGTLSGQSITWSSSSIASGASTTTLTFSATASVASKASFSAALLQTNPDPNISNNIATATIVIS